MPRKGPVPARQVLPDPKYHDLLVAKMVNVLMRRGKKGTAESIFYGALDLVQQKTGGDPYGFPALGRQDCSLPGERLTGPRLHRVPER